MDQVQIGDRNIAGAIQGYSFWADGVMVAPTNTFSVNNNGVQVQKGSDNYQLLAQAGADNTAIQLQGEISGGNSFNNQSRIQQDGFGNFALEFQDGDNHTSRLYQLGSGNSHELWQSGSSMSSTVNQIGDGNSSYVSQSN